MTEKVGRRLQIFVVAVVMPFGLQAGTNVWTAARVPGVSAARVRFDPQDADRLLAMTPGGLYQSVDAGLAWQLLNTDLSAPLQNMAVHPTDGRKVLLSSGLDLLMSQSGGNPPWSRNAIPGGFGFTEVMYSSDGSASYAVRGADVYRSTDSGLTWLKRGTLPSANFVLMGAGPAGSDTLYVLSSPSTVLVSRDAAASWQPTATQPPPGQVFGFLVQQNGRLFVAGAQGLHVSNDGGLSWSATTMTGDLRAIAGNPSQVETLYVVDAAGRVSRSLDAGSTWSVLSTITVLDSPQIAIAPSRTSRIAVAEGTTIWFSDNSGQTWNIRSQGLNAATVDSISTGRERIYLGLRGGELAWMEPGSSASGPMDSTGIRAAGLPVSVNVAAVPGTPDVLLAIADRGLVLRSTNAGAHWSPLADLPSSLLTSAIVVSRAEPRVLYAITPSGIMKSTDRGATWNTSNSGLSQSDHPQYLAVGPGDTVYLTVVSPQPPLVYRVYRSADAGGHWNQVGPARDSAVLGLSAHPVDPLTVFLQTHVPSDLLRSRDGGQTWESMPLCCMYGGVVFDPRNARIGYAAGRGIVFRSVDGGDSWRSVAPDPLMSQSPGSYAFSLDPADPDTLLLAGGLGLGLRQLKVMPDLVVTATAPATALPSSAVTVNHVVRNTGPFDATRVRLTMETPAGATAVAASASGGTCTAGATTSCTFDVLRVGESVAVSITATPAGTGSFAVLASVSAEQADPVRGDNSVSSVVAVAAAATPPSPGADGGGGGGTVGWSALSLCAWMLAVSRKVRLRRIVLTKPA